MLRHRYNTGNHKLFFNVGFSNGFVRKAKNETEKTVTLYNLERIQYGNVVPIIRNYEFGALLGLGYGIKRYSIELRYEIGNGFSNVRSLKTTTNRLYVLGSYKVLT